MSSQERLRNAYPIKATPNRFGSHFNERPQPDAFGRREATPAEIERAMMGGFNPPVDRTPRFSTQGRRPLTEEEQMKLERQQRRREAERMRNHGNR